MPKSFPRDVCVIGGGGHVGLPLALTFADCGLRTVIYDVNHHTVETIQREVMPFHEEGGQAMLQKALASGLLEADHTPRLLPECEFAIFDVGTPVDEHLNPNFTVIHKALDGCADWLRDRQVLILRS